MTGTYGVTITGDVATITLSVPALWWLAVTVMAGVFLTWTTVRDWLAGVLARVRQDEKQSEFNVAMNGLVNITNRGAGYASMHNISASPKGMRIWE